MALDPDPGFDQFALPPEHEQLRRSVRSLAEEVIAPRAAEIDQTEQFPWDVHEALAAAGFSAAHVPEAYGGAGGDSLAVCLIIEEVARVCVSSSLIPAVNKLGSLPIMIAGSAEQAERYLGPLARGEALISYALSEREAGSDAGSLRTRAVRDGDDWVITGQKSWISGAGESAYYVVMASTDPAAGARGISAFVVEKDDPGLSFGAPERKLGVRGSPTRELLFDSCRIPGDRLIGEPGTGFATAMRTLDHTRVTIGAQAVGVAQGALDYATAYARQRQQFGRSIGDFQGIQFLLADMAMKVSAARALVYTAAAKSERDDPDLRYFGAAAKCFAADTAMAVTTDAVQVLGGAGYVRDHPVERMMRDAKITQIYEGTNQIQRVVMARHLLG
ncbi:MAG: acyl-CoA dehydrogenase [Actinomycetota bacterium]|nr:MAG: acyl-CoA dehydrogenase [Actinomycetota bacterium]